MKIFLAAYQPDRVGGGWSFSRNLAKSLGDDVVSYDEADIFFVSGASMIKPEEAEQAKRDGKKVVLRVDNALKHSRNQGKGMERMRRVAAVADLVVYQCQWAKDYLDDFLGHPNSRIIYNGVDLDIFYPGDRSKLNGSRYLYSCSSKNETKRWEWVWWRYQQIQKENPGATLFITGSISTPVLENGFDFFQGERYRYLGVIDNPQNMADIYRASDYLFAVYSNDCYSNTCLEALACGVELIEVDMTGGTPELIRNWEMLGREWNGLDRMATDYISALEGL